MTPRPHRCAALLLLAMAACRAPLAVRPLDSTAAHRALTSNVLSTGTASESTRTVLRRYALTRQFAAAPERAIAQLRALVLPGLGRSDEIFALAELSYLHAEELMRVRHRPVRHRPHPGPRPKAAPARVEEARAHYLAAAVYAYAFLFPEPAVEDIALIDPRVRWACRSAGRPYGPTRAKPDIRRAQKGSW